MTAISFSHYNTNNRPNRSQTQVLRWRHALGAAVVLAIVACFGPQTPTAAATPGLSSAAAHTTAMNVVGRNWLDDLLNDLDDVEEALEGASDQAVIIEGGGSELAQAQLDNLLDEAVSSIDAALQHGFFDGVDLELINPLVTPQSLLEYAADTHSISLEAQAQVLFRANPDPQVVAEQLNTIRQLIERISPHSYRSTAGL